MKISSTQTDLGSTETAFESHKHQQSVNRWSDRCHHSGVATIAKLICKLKRWKPCSECLAVKTSQNEPNINKETTICCESFIEWLSEPHIRPVPATHCSFLSSLSWLSWLSYCLLTRDRNNNTNIIMTLFLMLLFWNEIRNVSQIDKNLFFSLKIAFFALGSHK